MSEKEVYQKSSELFNNCCAICGSPYIQLHHIIFGKLHGTRKALTYYGNIIPLCKKHHDMAHKNKLNDESQLSMKNLKERLERKINNER